MSIETSTRPFQVGDRVRITDNNRHHVHPDAQYVFEGVVTKIDPPADPDSEYTYGPYLWAETEPYTSPKTGEVFDRVFCPLTDGLTTGSDAAEFGRSIELLEPAPTNSSGDAVTASGPASSDDMKALAADLAHWAEHALVALDPTSLLAGKLRDSINAYRKAVSS